MITGFNTDIEHEGTVYHVQTEDKGLETPIILSLVYVGGAILASKRSPYDDLVGSGFDATALSERLNRQHKLICAAITAGRIEELKRLNRQGDGATVARKSSRKSAKAQPPAAKVDTAEPVAETQPAAEVPTVSERADVSTVSTVSAVPAQSDASPAAEAPVQADADAAANGDAASAQTTAEEFKSELPSWFETTAESFASILEKVAASEAAQAEAARAEAARAEEEAKAEAAKAEAAEAEQRRRFPPKDALVASGVAQPADVLVEAAAPTAHFETPATDSAPAPQPEVREIIPVEVEGELHVSLMEERDYKAGEIVTLRVRVSRGPLDAREAVAEAVVTVKVLGTEFRPLILTSKTDRDGVAVIHAWLPRFTSGRAAILVRAAHDGFTAELRRAVRHL